MARPGEVRQLNKLLEEQSQQRDPFQAPRMVSARNQGRLSFPQDPITETVVSESEPRPVPQAELETRTDNTLREFLMRRDLQQEERLQKTTVPKELRKLGLGDLVEGISFNQLGRLNLVLKLRERFGERFFENDTARNALNLFDSALTEDQQTEREEMEERLTSTEATLEELFRMQQQSRRGRVLR
jgi:hypothetical protein